MAEAAAELRGAHVLLLTPFDAEGRLDASSLRSLIDYVVDRGPAGVVALGTTGEFFTMSPEERREAMTSIADLVGGRVRVTYGVGDSSTAVAVELARHAESCGADAVMVQPPYYYKHAQGAMEGHLAAVAEAVNLPVMVYDGAAGIEVSVDLLARLSRAVAGIRYVKVATPEPEKIGAILDAAPGLKPFCGDENMLVLARRFGAVGSTVGIGNVVPEAVARVERAVDEGRMDEARAVQAEQIAPLVSVCTIEKAGYIRSYKEILAALGVIASPATRLPLQPLHRLRREEVLATARALGVL